jgi:hypothetical protein
MARHGMSHIPTPPSWLRYWPLPPPSTRPPQCPSPAGFADKRLCPTQPTTTSAARCCPFPSWYCASSTPRNKGRKQQGRRSRAITQFLRAKARSSSCRQPVRTLPRGAASNSPTDGQIVVLGQERWPLTLVPTSGGGGLFAARRRLALHSVQPSLGESRQVVVGTRQHLSPRGVSPGSTAARLATGWPPDLSSERRREGER